MPPDCLQCLEPITLHLSEDLKRDLQELAMQEEQGVSAYNRSVLSLHVYLRNRAADQAR